MPSAGRASQQRASLAGRYYEGHLAMRIKKPPKASIDEVRIAREGDMATIENADPSISVARLTVGPELGSMTERLLVRNPAFACELAHGRTAVQWAVAPRFLLRV
jgi:hypothetical protein